MLKILKSIVSSGRLNFYIESKNVKNFGTEQKDDLIFELLHSLDPDKR